MMRAYYRVKLIGAALLFPIIVCLIAITDSWACYVWPELRGFYPHWWHALKTGRAGRKP